MTATDSDIAQKDEPFWVRPLTLNFKSFFSGVSKAIEAATVQDWKKAGEAAKDLVSAIGIARSSQQCAGLLLNRSMRRAIFDLLQDYRSDIQRELNPEESARLAKQLDDDLETVTVSLDQNFFDRPREIPLIAIFVQRLEQWLISTGLTQHSPRAIAARLPSYFVYAMHCELRDRKVDYSPVVQFIRTEVADAWQRERTWQAYRLRLERQLDEPMFGEGFGLRDIFLWPRGWFEKPDPAENGSPDRDDLPVETSSTALKSSSPHTRVTERHVVLLKEALDAWVSGDSAANERERREDAIRILSGDPGAGKSSFVRMYAQHRIEEHGDRVLIVPLHLLNVTLDFEAALERFCEQLDDCPIGLLKAESAEQRLLLILDGLDELAKQGTSGAALAQAFFENVETTVRLRNLSELRLQVLISGRPIAVQNVRNRFRRPGLILHMLPYFVPESERKRDGQTPLTENGDHYCYGGQTSLLESDQRQSWWKSYGRLKGLSLDGLPPALQSQKLDEITAQPLLNYLIALVYQRGNVDFSSDMTRNEIYSDLLDSVYERTWDSSKGHITTRDISREDFRELLEEMALTAWHDRERVTTVKAVRARCDTMPHLKQALDQYEQRFNAGVSQLFTAFYFRKAEQVEGPEPTFEFTHKSFGEYLTACRIVDALQEIHEAFAESQSRRRRTANVWNEAEALLQWLRTCGPSAITEDLLVFLSSEVKLRHLGRRNPVASERDSAHEAGCAEGFRQTLARLINAVLRQGMPCEKLGSGVTFAQICEQSRQAETALLVLHSCCVSALIANQSGSLEPTVLDWPSPNALGTWLRRLVGQPAGWNPSLAVRCLSGIAMQHQILIGAFLANVNLNGANLSEADLSGANLSGTDLSGANLREADLSEANLREANLSGADLSEADLIGANLREANLKRANLILANLRGANLRGADLGGANLIEADLGRANLIEANLGRAHLIGANLRGANLREANLSDANLRGAILSEASLSETNLSEANLRGVDLGRAYLGGVDFSRADLGRAHLIGANLRGANLGGANVTTDQLKLTRGTPQCSP